jgi:hypothetical protein
MAIVSDGVGDAETTVEVALDVSGMAVSWLDTDRMVIVSMTDDEAVGIIAELEEDSTVVEARLELSDNKSEIVLVDDAIGSVVEGGGSITGVVRSAIGVSLEDARVSLASETSDEAETSVELSKAMDVMVSRTDGVMSEATLVALSIGMSVVESKTSVVVINMLLVTVGVMLVEELMMELDDDDALHLPLTSISAFLGTVPFCAGKVTVHSLRSLILLTPRRDKRR